MPYVHVGGTLEQLLHFKKNFPVELVVFWAAQIIEGVGYLHQNEVLHRDLKLDNILFDTNGYITIIDFGVSRRLKFLEDAETYAGTRGFQAPE